MNLIWICLYKNWLCEWLVNTPVYLLLNSFWFYYLSLHEDCSVPLTCRLGPNSYTLALISLIQSSIEALKSLTSVSHYCRKTPSKGHRNTRILVKKIWSFQGNILPHYILLGYPINPSSWSSSTPFIGPWKKQTVVCPSLSFFYKYHIQCKNSISTPFPFP